VERAARVPRAAARPRRLWLGGALTFAAAAGMLLLYRVGARDEDGGLARNRIKGGEVCIASIRIAAADGSNQRSFPSGSSVRLQAGERLRLGYRVLKPRHLAALSIDDAGQVTPLYPEGGNSLAVAATTSTPALGPAAVLIYLPDSVELTGTGHERIYLLVAEQAFTVDDALAATRAAFARSGPGNVANMAAPALAAGSIEILSWLFEKP
jgi:hypothetical protein